MTLISYGAMVPVSLTAAEQAEEALGVSMEVIDLRTLIPYDVNLVLESVRKTGRVIVIHEAPKTCGFGAELAATISEKALLHLESPVYRVTGFDTPFPYALEEEYLPSPAAFCEPPRTASRSSTPFHKHDDVCSLLSLRFLGQINIAFT